MFWLLLLSQNEAYAEEVTTVQTTPSESSTATTIILTPTAIIEAASLAITQAETATALIQTQATAITQPTETVTATITEAQNSIQQAQAVVDSATVAIANQETATALVNTQTQIVASDSATVLSAQAAVDSSAIETITNGITATTYASPGGSSPELPSENAIPLSTTTLPNIAHQWGSGQVLNSGRVDNVIVKLEGTITVPEEAVEVWYGLHADDGTKMYIDGQLAINNWVDKGPSWGPMSPRYNTTTDKQQDFIIWYYENGGGASLILGYAVMRSDGTGYWTT